MSTYNVNCLIAETDITLTQFLGYAWNDGYTSAYLVFVTGFINGQWHCNANGQRDTTYRYVTKRDRLVTDCTEVALIPHDEVALAWNDGDATVSNVSVQHYDSTLHSWYCACNAEFKYFKHIGLPAKVSSMSAREYGNHIEPQIINDILNMRGKIHGDFSKQAPFFDAVQSLFMAAPNWDKLSSKERYAINMIIAKFTRLMYGDNTEPDHWRDIVGYSILASKHYGNIIYMRLENGMEFWYNEHHHVIHMERNK